MGAGAAGLMTAIWAGRTANSKKTPLQILLLDSRPKIGAKILMSGGTRCNVTNREVKPTDFQGEPQHFIKHVFEAFTPTETIRFFKEIGVDLILESTGKYFPKTHSAQTVLDALNDEIVRLRVILKRGFKVIGIEKTGNEFRLKNAEGEEVLAKKVVISTGGLSHPTTGSDGAGYVIAKSFGHSIIQTFPALTPLLTADPDWKALSGISLEVKLSFFKNRKKECEFRDSFLFTHFGFSGPAALDISRYFASADSNTHPEIVVNFLPTYDAGTLKEFLNNAKIKNPNKLVKNILIDEFFLPERLVKTFFKKVKINESTTAGKKTTNERKRLVQSLINYPLEVTGVFGYQKAEVTAGGVDLKEINVSTMESKLVSNLYFAGEILNVDGRIGGFNFQWAWSTGAICGRSAAKG